MTTIGNKPNDCPRRKGDLYCCCAKTVWGGGFPALSFVNVSSTYTIAGMREKTHSRKAIRKLGTEYIVDHRGLGRRIRAIPQSLDDTSTDELRNS